MTGPARHTGVIPDPAQAAVLRRFELADMSVEFACPHCRDALWFTDNEYKTLGDIIDALLSHTCWANDDEWHADGAS